MAVNAFFIKWFALRYVLRHDLCVAAILPGNVGDVRRTDASSPVFLSILLKVVSYKLNV